MEAVCFSINPALRCEDVIKLLKISLSSSHHQHIEHPYVTDFFPYLQKPYLQNFNQCPPSLPRRNIL